MRTLPWLLAVMLIAAPALTGCIGGDGGGDDEPGNETDDTGDAGDGSGNGSEANESEDDGFGGDDEEDPSWQSENRTGTVSPTSQVTGDGASETFTVSDGAEELVLNLTASGGELDMCIMKPGGDGSGNSTAASSGAQQQEACSETKTTQDGNASFQASSPESGDWTVKLTAAQGTTSEVEYTLTIAQKVPLDEQATDDEDSGDGNSTAQRATVAP